MAWRVPRFGIRHSLRDAGAAAVSVLDTIATGYKAYLHDGRRDLLILTNSLSTHYAQVNLGSGYASLAVDRLFVPAGHNFDTQTLRVREDDNASMTSATELLSEAISGPAFLDFDLDQESAEQYLRVDFPSSTFIPQIPELWLTKTLTPSQSARPSWGDTPVHNAESFAKPSGDRADLSLGGSQRVFTLEYPHIDVAADIAIFDQLVDTVGITEPFLFDPPFDDEPAMICKMLTRPRRDFDNAVPASTGKAYRYRFELIEQIG